MATMLAKPATPEPEVGQVVITFDVANNDDLRAARNVRGARVRRVTLVDVLMETGASHLCLPADTIATLGLPLHREVDVETAHGDFHAESVLQRPRGRVGP